MSEPDPDTMMCGCVECCEGMAITCKLDFERGLAKGREDLERLMDGSHAVGFREGCQLAETRIRQLEEALREVLDVAELYVPVPLDAPGFSRARAALRAEPAPPAGGEQEELIHADDARADAFNMPPPGSDQT